MVAAIYSNVTTVADVKLRLGDRGTSDTDSFLTSPQYTDFIMKRIIAKASAYSLERVVAGYWRFIGSIYLFMPSSTACYWTPAGEDGCTYITTPNGNVVLSAGTHAGTDNLVTTGPTVDLPELMVDLCMFLAQHRDRKSVV